MKIFILVMYFWGYQNYDFIGEPYYNKAKCEYYASYMNKFDKPKSVVEFKCVSFQEVNK